MLIIANVDVKMQQADLVLPAPLRWPSPTRWRLVVPLIPLSVYCVFGLQTIEAYYLWSLTSGRPWTKGVMYLRGYLLVIG